MTSTHDAKAKYDAAKGTMKHADKVVLDARLLMIDATQDYAQALVDDQLRKFDSAGIVVGETVCCVPGDMSGRPPFIVTRLEAVPDDDLVFAFGDDGKCVAAAHLRPYHAPEEMVLGSARKRLWGSPSSSDRFRLTLTGITPADLDGMQPGAVITGQFTMEKL